MISAADAESHSSNEAETWSLRFFLIGKRVEFTPLFPTTVWSGFLITLTEG
jgi:hypothetical protein